MKKIIVNSTNIKSYLNEKTISYIAYEFLNVIPSNKAEAKKRYDLQKLIRGAINGTNGLKPKRTILHVCKEIAKDHEWLKKGLRMHGDFAGYAVTWEWGKSYSKEEAPMWGNYDKEEKISLEEAMSYMLYNRIKPYLMDNKKQMFSDRFTRVW